MTAMDKDRALPSNEEILAELDRCREYSPPGFARPPEGVPAQRAEMKKKGADAIASAPKVQAVAAIEEESAIRKRPRR